MYPQEKPCLPGNYAKQKSTWVAVGMAILGLMGRVVSPVQAQVSEPLKGGENPPAKQVVVQPAAPTRETPAEVGDDYRLDVGDLIAIDVRRHEAVSRTVKIPADGRIRLPRLMSAIEAKGKTCAELAELLTQKLTEEGKLVLRPGQVTVNVAEMRIRRIYVRGNSGRSGDFDLKPGWRITELMAVIGGVPNPERIKAQLLNPNRPKPVNIDLVSALDNPDSAQNLPLQEGDTLTLDLPRNKRFYIKGEGPRGLYELDERFGLRQALIQVGFNTNGATGDLRHALLIRRSIPGDPNSEPVRIPVDLYALLTKPEAEEIPLEDMDTLEIPVSTRFIYIFGQTSAPKRFVLPEDRKTFLVDLMALGDTSPRAKIDDIKIWRVVDGKRVQQTYKFGKYLADGDLKQNPEILDGDLVFVPDVKRADPVSTVWTAWGFYGILSTFIPGIRP
jgi:protein involved in polysaccharide export with SLBB domain